jgi:ribulose-5-phosphate 4-epimerase/fuculose-1-phosphate aldolase
MYVMLSLVSSQECTVKYTVSDLLFYLGQVAQRLCFIEAAAGTSGNISVRADNIRPEDLPELGSRHIKYHKLDKEFPDLRGDRFLITGSGKNLRYIAARVHECLALIELIQGGYHIMWGLGEEETITSECTAHFMTYQRRPQASAFIHAQPTSINVLTRLFRSEDSLNRLLLAQHEQLKIYSPGGIGLVDTVRHGSGELADAVSSSLADKVICAVVRHGTFSLGEQDPISGLNTACDLQEYYHDAARTFLDNPWLRLMPVDFLLKNLGRVSRLPFGSKMVDAFLRPPK